MTEEEPSIQEWRGLYQAAREFKKIECWDWMWDSDLFGVQDPVSGEIGYCCVLGRVGEHFALAVYSGTDGLEGYLQTRSGEVLPSYPEALHLQKCLMASFEDRAFLQPKDLRMIKALGLQFRGRTAWPLFRSYRPGYHPWYVTREEAQFLTVALHQTIEVAVRFKADPELLTPPRENHYLVRVPQQEKAGLRWTDEWLEPRPLDKPVIVAQPLDEDRLERLNRTITERRGIWEIDSFYSLMGVAEKGERPYYPLIILWVERSSKFKVNHYLAHPSEGLSELLEQFMILAENIGSLPQEIVVKKAETFKLLESITRKLGIKLRKVASLRALEEVQTSMFEIFMRRASNV